VQYALLAGPLLSMLDSSIVNVAVEPIARELHASLTVVQWTEGLVAAPLVPLAMSMLLGGGGGGQDQGDQGPASQDCASQVAGRGRGARGISPLAGILLFLGPALGPTAGGALIAAAGWRAIFLINVPAGLLAAVAARAIPAALAPERQPGARFDLPGLILLAAGLTGLLLRASQGASARWSAPACWLPLAAGAALTAGYAAWAQRCTERREQPVLDLTLARRRGPVLSMGLCALASVVTWAAVFLLPVFVQTAQGRSALVAGLALAPQGLITGLSTALAPRWLARLTVRVTVLAGFAVLAVASLGLLLITAATSLWLIAVILAARSVSIGLIINPLLQALLQPLRPDQLGDASTLFNAWQRIAGSFGIGLVAALYATQARATGPVAALHAAGLVLVAIAAIGALGALALPATRNTALEY
jgi:MFS family permease